MSQALQYSFLHSLQEVIPGCISQLSQTVDEEEGRLTGGEATVRGVFFTGARLCDWNFVIRCRRVSHPVHSVCAQSSHRTAALDT